MRYSKKLKIKFKLTKQKLIVTHLNKLKIQAMLIKMQKLMKLTMRMIA